MATYYVATNGSDLNAGTESSPWSLAHAMSSGNTTLQGGDTVLIQPGQYTESGTFTCSKSGTSTAPIVYRAATNERPIFDLRFRANGDDCWFIGLEFAFLQSDARVTTTPGSDPPDIPRENASVLPSGDRVRFIQCIMRDLGDGLFAASTAVDLRVEECYVYNNGWLGPDRGHGHGIYLQNGANGGRKIARNNAVWASYAHGIHIYGSNAAQLKDIDLLGNAVFWAGAPAGEDNNALLWYGASTGNLGYGVVRGNSFLTRLGTSTALSLGSGSPLHEDMEITSNRFSAQLRINRGTGMTFTDNLIAPLGAMGASGVTIGVTRGTETYANFATFDFNRYYKQTGDTRPYFARATESAIDYSLAAWNTATGYDANGTATTNAIGAPTEPEVVYVPSRYTLGRGHIHAWNFDGASTVSVDVGRIVPNGFPYAIYHVFDYVTNGQPLVKGIADGTLVTLPMDARTPPTPFGGNPLPQMDNTFGVFVVTPRPRWTITTRGGLG